MLQRETHLRDREASDMENKLRQTRNLSHELKYITPQGNVDMRHKNHCINIQILNHSNRT